jgi:hypothetical protein
VVSVTDPYGRIFEVIGYGYCRLNEKYQYDLHSSGHYLLCLLFKKRNVSETGSCLRLQVEPTQMGEIDTASLCLAETKTRLSRFHLKT